MSTNSKINEISSNQSPSRHQTVASGYAASLLAVHSPFPPAAENKNAASQPHHPGMFGNVFQSAHLYHPGGGASSQSDSDAFRYLSISFFLAARHHPLRGRRSSYSLTLPSTMPLMKNRCRNGYTHSTGSMPRKICAARIARSFSSDKKRSIVGSLICVMSSRTTIVCK